MVAIFDTNIYLCQNGHYYCVKYMTACYPNLLSSIASISLMHTNSGTEGLKHCITSLYLMTYIYSFYLKQGKHAPEYQNRTIPGSNPGHGTNCKLGFLRGVYK